MPHIMILSIYSFKNQQTKLKSTKKKKEKKQTNTLFPQDSSYEIREKKNTK